MAIKPKKTFLFTESELKDRNIGKFITTSDLGKSTKDYRLKKACYEAEGVWPSYQQLRESFTGLLIYSKFIKIGKPDRKLAARCAQMMMDTFLLRRVNGETVSIPLQVVPITIDKKMKDKPKTGLELFSGEDFEDNKSISENEKLRWIFENLQRMDVKPEDAPTLGTYALMMQMRGSKEQARDFHKTLWPKLFTKEDAERGGKLADDGKETIDLCERLLAAVESEL